MLRGTFDTGELRISLFHQRGSEHPQQDRWGIWETENGDTRIGLADGATPWRSRDTPGGDAAAYAAETAIRALGTHHYAREALEQANAILWHDGLDYPRQQAMSALIAVDIRTSLGRLDYDAHLAGDCELWSIHDTGPPLLVIGGPAVKPEPLRHWLETPQAHSPDYQTRLLAEAEAFKDKATWKATWVGQYERGRYTSACGKATTLILASDGARLMTAFASGTTPSTLEAWLAHTAEETPRDDITVITVSLQPAEQQAHNAKPTARKEQLLRAPQGSGT